MRHAHAHGVLFVWGGLYEQPCHLMNALAQYKAGYAKGLRDAVE